MVGHDFCRLLFQPLRDEDVGVEESLHAVPEAVLGLGLELFSGFGVLDARVPALFVQLVDHRLANETNPLTRGEVDQLTLLLFSIFISVVISNLFLSLHLRLRVSLLQ